jgi:DNA polymerase III psi subunit
MESETMSSPKALFGDLTSTLDEKVAFVEVSEEKLQRSFERLIEIRKQKALLEEKEQSLKVMLTIT